VAIFKKASTALKLHQKKPPQHSVAAEKTQFILKSINHSLRDSLQCNQGIAQSAPYIILFIHNFFCKQLTV
jgi:hypothetical protein